MLRITQRSCRLGDKYAGKLTEEDSGNEALTLKIDLQNIIMSAEELNALLGHPHAFDRLFEDIDGVPTPVFNAIKAIELTKAWEGANVALSYEFGTEARKVELKRATLSKIRVMFRQGGEVSLHCTVEGEPVLDRKFTDIVERLGEAIECEIHAHRPDDQKSLPLNNHDSGPDGREGRAPKKSAH